MQELGNGLHLGLLHAARGQSVGADADSTWSGGRLVSRDRVLVECDVSQVADLLNLGTGQAKRAQIPKDKVVLGPIGLQFVVVGQEAFGNGLYVRQPRISLYILVYGSLD